MQLLIKRLTALQIHGVEYFFEFYKNLEILNEFSKIARIGLLFIYILGLKIINKTLQKIFKNLDFKAGDISSSLKNPFLR